MDKNRSRLIIKHFGAIKEVDIEINKINVIIGCQSSGKSTIAKVLSFCQWAEKRYIIDGKFNYTVEDMLQNFHRIGDEYFMKNTYVEYRSEAVKITFDHQKKITFTLLDENRYYKSKNIYIPAERNFATTIPNLGRYNETNDNIMNLLYDWNDAKKQYKRIEDILDLGFSFSYDNKKDEEYVHFASQGGEEVKMLLRFASSGLQSMIPLVLLFDYLTSLFYEKEKPLSPNERELINKIVTEKFDSNEFFASFKSMILKEKNVDQIKDLVEQFSELITKEINIDELKLEIKKANPENIGNYHFSKFIIEEPEQNLYPETQKALVYYFLKTLNLSKYNHQLFITTHSPFILYSLNNCMMGHQIEKRMPSEERSRLDSRDSWVNPSLVSVWQLEDGMLIDVKESDTKVIGPHSFDEIMNGVMGEYFEMLGYFGDAE